MTAADYPTFRSALLRLCACYDKQLTSEQRDAWGDQLERYPIDAIVQALRSAPAESGRFFPNVGLVEQLAKKHMGGTPRSTGDWHAPDVTRNEDGVVVARWRCVFCEDTGWRAKQTDTGQLLTNDELIRRREALRVPREDGEPTYRMSRCSCRIQGQQQDRGAA
jgi:hypothetical protein